MTNPALQVQARFDAAVRRLGARDVVAIPVLKNDVLFVHPVGGDVVAKPLMAAADTDFDTVE